MDPYDSQTSQSREPWPAPAGGTPIYDRLVAEWRAAGREHPSAEPSPSAPPSPERPYQEPAPRGTFVPTARTPEETLGG
ncbi:hypothetical protein ABMX48_07680 [Streptomyces cavourensis]